MRCSNICSAIGSLECFRIMELTTFTVGSLHEYIDHPIESCIWNDHGITRIISYLLGDTSRRSSHRGQGAG